MKQCLKSAEGGCLRRSQGRNSQATSCSLWWPLLRSLPYHLHLARWLRARASLEESPRLLIWSLTQFETMLKDLFSLASWEMLSVSLDRLLDFNVVDIIDLLKEKLLAEERLMLPFLGCSISAWRRRLRELFFSDSSGSFLNAHS